MRARPRSFRGSVDASDHAVPPCALLTFGVAFIVDNLRGGRHAVKAEPTGEPEAPLGIVRNEPEPEDEPRTRTRTNSRRLHVAGGPHRPDRPVSRPASTGDG